MTPRGQLRKPIDFRLDDLHLGARSLGKGLLQDARLEADRQERILYLVRKRARRGPEHDQIFLALQGNRGIRGS